MAQETITGAGAFAATPPVIHRIGLADLKDALVKGFDDFNLMPTHLVFLGLIYPIVVIVAARVAAGYDVLQLVFPLLAGYTLIGPLVAVSMYELSRRHELGLDTSRRHAFDILRFHSLQSVAILGALLMVVYFAWMFTAQAIYAYYFGYFAPASIMDFVTQILTTPSGWMLIITGNVVGFVFAAFVFSVSVVSFPLLMDRDVGITLAVTTSVRVVLANPLVMATWGIIVAAGLLLGALPFFVGLTVALPVLGHATWHLYRKLVEF